RQRIGEAVQATRFEQRRRQPGGLVGVPDGARFAEIAGPEDIVRRRSLPIVGAHDSRKLPEHGRVPELPRWPPEDLRRGYESVILGRSGHRVEKRTPDRLRLLPIEALEEHRNRNRATWRKGDPFAPMRIEKRLAIEFDDLGDEATVGVVGRRLDDSENRAEEIWKLVRAQSDAGDDSEPASAALERPEEVGIGAGVGDFDVAVGGHDLSLQEARPGQAIGLRKAAEAAPLDQTGDADGHAAA